MTGSIATAPTDARTVLANNYRLFIFYARKATPPEYVEDVANEAAVIFLRKYNPARCSVLAGFVSLVVRSAAHRFRKRELPHVCNRAHLSHESDEQTGLGLEDLAEVQGEPGVQYDELCALERALRRLDKTARFVLTHRFGLCGAGSETQQAVANQLGVSKARVGQVEHRALAKLRAILETGCNSVCEVETDGE